MTWPTGYPDAARPHGKRSLERRPESWNVDADAALANARERVFEGAARPLKTS